MNCLLDIWVLFGYKNNLEPKSQNAKLKLKIKKYFG